MNKKILLIEIAGKGGICHYTYNLAQAMSKLRKVVLATGKSYEFVDKQRDFELAGIFNHVKTNPLKVVQLIAMCAAKDIGAVHIQVSQYPAFILFLCIAIKRFARKNVVLTAHNVTTHEQKQWEAHIYKRLYQLADRIVVHAQANKKEIADLFGIAEQKIAVIPHGNYTFFNTGGAVPAVNGECNVLFFGYIRKYKGLMHLIRAMKLVRDKMPRARLIIAGRATEGFAEYQQAIDDLGLGESIEKNLDYISFEQVKQYFERANVVAMPYENIYQSGVVQVAYGFGRPVVATDVGGFPEAVEDGKSGFIVPPKDVNALAEKLITILNDARLQQKMGAYGLHLAQTKFSWESIARTTAELYSVL